MPSAAAHRHIPPVKSSVDPDDPYSRLKARPGLGTESHLQDETVVSDVVMDKYCSSHWHRSRTSNLARYHAFGCAYVCVCMCVCLVVSVSVSVCVCASACACMQLRVHVRVCVCARVFC